MTVATADGVADAHSQGFRLLNASIGFVYTGPPSGLRSGPPLARWEYSMALLYSA